MSYKTFKLVSRFTDRSVINLAFGLATTCVFGVLATITIVAIFTS